MEDLAILIIPLVIGGFFLVWMAFYLFILGIIIASLVIWIFMLVDVAKRDFKNDNDKIIWVLIVALTGIIGAIIYYFVIKKPEDKKNKTKNKSNARKKQS